MLNVVLTGMGITAAPRTLKCYATCKLMSFHRIYEATAGHAKQVTRYTGRPAPHAECQWCQMGASRLRGHRRCCRAKNAHWSHGDLLGVRYTKMKRLAGHDSV
jgi:hypothetical protein